MAPAAAQAHPQISLAPNLSTPQIVIERLGTRLPPNVFTLTTDYVLVILIIAHHAQTARCGLSFTAFQDQVIRGYHCKDRQFCSFLMYNLTFAHYSKEPGYHDDGDHAHNDYHDDGDHTHSDYHDDGDHTHNDYHDDGDHTHNDYHGDGDHSS